MRDMPGNPHIAVAKFRTEGLHEIQSDEGLTDTTQITTAIDANTEATLTLAYEQRTVALVEFARMHADFGLNVDNAIVNQIAERLGITEETK